MGIFRRFFSRKSTGFATTDDVGTQYALLKTTRRRGRWHVLLGAPPSAEFRRPAVLITTHKRRIREYLAQRDYDAAEAYYRTVRHCYAQPAYQAVRQHYWQLHRDEVLSALHELLSEFRFKEANAGVMQIPNLVGYVHEGSFTLSLTSDEGLSTSFDFEVVPSALTVYRLAVDQPASGPDSVSEPVAVSDPDSGAGSAGVSDGAA